MKSSGFGKTTAKTAQDVAKNIARQVAREPFEILKDAGEQIIPSKVNRPNETNQDKPQGDKPQLDTKQQEQKDQAFADRRMQALQNEVDEIRRQSVVKDLQAKISAGEEIPLEDYPELSMEQKQVLKAQMEAVKIQQAQANAQAGVQEVPTIHSKPSRRFGAGQKHEAEKQQTRVEKPVPPSG